MLWWDTALSTPTPEYTQMIILAYMKADCIEVAVEKYEQFDATYKIVTQTHLIQLKREEL